MDLVLVSIRLQMIHLDQPHTGKMAWFGLMTLGSIVPSFVVTDDCLQDCVRDCLPSSRVIVLHSPYDKVFPPDPEGGLGCSTQLD